MNRIFGKKKVVFVSHPFDGLIIVLDLNDLVYKIVDLVVIYVNILLPYLKRGKLDNIKII